jgi:hypothetical protein
MRLRACALVLALALPVATASSSARADGALTAASVVVDVAPDTAGIDAPRLRAAIGTELGAAAVAPDDPLAARARGTVTVAVDRASHALVVSYRESGTPITRSIDLPADPAAIMRAAVLLAGNLARNEAGDLVDSLRKSRPSSEAPAEPSFSRSVDDEERGKLDRLGAILDAHARDARGPRLAIQWTVIGGGLAAEGVGLGLTIGGHSESGLILVEAGETLYLANTLVAPGAFDGLARYYARARFAGLPPDLTREDVEQAWLRASRRERSNRKLFGWVAIVLGGAEAALLSAFIVSDLDSPRPSGSGGFVFNAAPSFLPVFEVMLASQVAAVGMGFALVATDGPVESALHDYEASAGYPIAPTVLREVGPRFALTPGGAIAGVGGRF